MNNSGTGKLWKTAFINMPEIIAGIALTVTLIATGVNVFTRYIFKFTYFWYTDVTILAFGWLVFSGAAAAFRRHMHFGIDILVNLLPRKGRAVFDVLLCLIITTIMALVLYSSIMLTSKVAGKQFPTILLNYKWFDASMIFGFGLMTIYSIIDMIKAAKKMVLTLKNAEVNKDE